MLSKSAVPASALALSLAVFWGGAHASSPILSVSDLVTASANLGAGAAVHLAAPSVYSRSDYWDTNYAQTLTSAFTTEVQTPPTATEAGLAYNYQTDTTTRSWDHTTWLEDHLSIGMTSDGVNQAGGKWIELTGRIQSTINTTVQFQLNAAGSFTATQTPLGAAAPQLSSFYFGSSAVLPMSATTTADLPSLSYTGTGFSGLASFNLLAGVAQSFVAYVYAPSDVSISSFSLDAWTSRYNVVTTPVVIKDVGPKTLVSASILSPIPEPEGLALSLTGLALIGLVARKARRQA